MTAQVIPFPISKRRRPWEGEGDPELARLDSIRRMATTLARYSPAGAERAFATPLRQKYEGMIRRGVAPDEATREIREYESAVRAYLLGLIARRNGGVA